MSLLPDNSYGALCKMQKDEARTVDCNCSVLEDRMLLPLRLAFGGRHFEVPLQQLFARSPAASGGGQDGPGAGRCALRIRQKAEAFRREAGPRRLHGAGALADGAAEGEDEPWILGGGFLRLFVAVLDFGTGRLGIAEAPGVPGGASAERAGASRLFEARS
ncbi:unnamed protein product [Prorocentrum cordatum]|uniref:Peptidase A1 domain-containing protein n=1 Tax=Prorocentrum cordatum TaxID=2364126 RepID=A0ABN9Q974_9DINO|nr:unnamed protein product [Polarella glacialis]